MCRPHVVSPLQQDAANRYRRRCQAKRHPIMSNAIIAGETSIRRRQSVTFLSVGTRPSNRVCSTMRDRQLARFFKSYLRLVTTRNLQGMPHSRAGASPSRGAPRTSGGAPRTSGGAPRTSGGAPRTSGGAPRTSGGGPPRTRDGSNSAPNR